MLQFLQKYVCSTIFFFPPRYSEKQCLEQTYIWGFCGLEHLGRFSFWFLSSLYYNLLSFPTISAPGLNSRNPISHFSKSKLFLYVSYSLGSLIALGTRCRIFYCGASIYLVGYHLATTVHPFFESFLLFSTGMLSTGLFATESWSSPEGKYVFVNIGSLRENRLH